MLNSTLVRYIYIFKSWQDTPEICHVNHFLGVQLSSIQYIHIVLNRCYPSPELFLFYFIFYSFIYFLSFCLFQDRFPWHMEVPRLGVELELQPPALTRATATQDPSRICDLHHSSRQCRILNPLSKARDQTRNLMVPSQIC